MSGIPDRAAIAMWGDEHRAKELINLCHAYFSREIKLTADNVLSHFRAIARKQKQRLVNEYFGTHWSITWRQFQSGALSSFPPQILANIAQDVDAITLGAGLLIGLFLDDPILLEISEDGSVIQHENFAVQGSGRTLAWANMLHRRFNSYEPIEIAKYIVYESKVMSESEVHVGKGTTMYVYSKDGGISDFVLDDEIAVLHHQFERLGPRKIPRRVSDMPQPSKTRLRQLTTEIMKRNEVPSYIFETENDPASPWSATDGRERHAKK